jgi:hypothetical protein
MADERTDYGIDRDTFITAWESNDYIEDVHEELAKLSRERGLEPMPKAIILSRASQYRRAGIDLKKYPTGRRPTDVDAANELVARLRAKRGSSEGQNELVDLVIEEIIRRLSKK